MKSKYRLAVSIPTYNRADLLDELLWNLGPQIEQHSDQCACYIIDNASTDHTAQIARQHQQRWKGIIYICNPSNIGGLRNIGEAINVPDAEWVWMMGDDDVPMPWGVGDLLTQLEDLESRCSNAVFMLLSDIKLTQEKARKLDQGAPFFTRPGDEITVYKNGSEAAEHGVHGLAWLSVLAVNRRYWNQARFEELATEADLYTHVRVLLEAAATESSAYTRHCYVYGTDRGSRQYYFSKTAIARVREFPQIERVVTEALGVARARKLLKPGRYGWIRERAQFAVKIGTFRDEYSEFLEFLRKPVSPFPEERALILAIYAATGVPMVRSVLRKLYIRSRGEQAGIKLKVGPAA